MGLYFLGTLFPRDFKLPRDFNFSLGLYLTGFSHRDFRSPGDLQGFDLTGTLSHRFRSLRDFDLSGTLISQGLRSLRDFDLSGTLISHGLWYHMDDDLTTLSLYKRIPVFAGWFSQTDNLERPCLFPWEYWNFQLVVGLAKIFFNFFPQNSIFFFFRKF